MSFGVIAERRPPFFFPAYNDLKIYLTGTELVRRFEKYWISALYI